MSEQYYHCFMAKKQLINEILNFSVLFGGHLGRHLEYLKLLKGEESTSPQILLCTPST